MEASANTRPLLWLALALPGAGIAYRWIATPDRYGFGHAIGETGDWAAWLLLLALAVTPLHLIFGRRTATTFLLRRRRDIGVASFAYAAAHTAIYLADKAVPAVIIQQAGDPSMLAGWLALALFIPLAATSNDLAVRALKRSWKRLHRLVYPAAILTVVHWVLAAYDPGTAYLYLAVLGLLELVRIALQRRQRVT